jgi:hypothetical protein
MDLRSQEHFDKILKKTPKELNEQEIAFLRARSSYLKKSQLEEYDSVLNPKPEIYVAKKDRKNQTSEELETVKQNANTE